MRLSEALEGRGTVMIGTDKGSGFIYKGPAADCTMYDREVVEVYPSVRYKGVDIIIVKGRESSNKPDGLPYEYHGCFDDAAAQRLLAGIYGQVADELGDAYGKEGCLLPYYDTMKGLTELGNAIQLAPGHGKVMEHLVAARKALNAVKEWIDHADRKGHEKWLMRDKSPDVYGHLQSPEGVIRAVKEVESKRRKGRWMEKNIID